MAHASADTPKRAWLKASEVCELAQLQPYVLRTWEMEFSDLGRPTTPGGPRVYRRADLDRVLRIKQLVFGEGLTLAGARRKIESEEAGPGDELPFEDEPVTTSKGKLSADARKRIVTVRNELRTLLAILSRPAGNGHAMPASAAASRPPASARPVAQAAADGRKTVTKRSGKKGH